MIGFLSDFGGKNGYVAQMKGVASKITDTRFIDISHNVGRHSIKRGSFILSTSYSYFPVGSVFVCVIDPGVGTEREGIVVKSGGYYFVGPNNGLLHKASMDAGDPIVHEIKNKSFCLDKVSSTFDGRDVFSPIGAYLAEGIELEEIGPEINNFKSVDFGDWKREKNLFTGRILFVDSFGNLITNIPFSDVDEIEFGDTVSVGDRGIGFEKSYGVVSEKELLLTVGGHGYLELSANRGSAEKILGLGEGDKLFIKTK